MEFGCLNSSKELFILQTTLYDMRAEKSQSPAIILGDPFSGSYWETKALVERETVEKKDLINAPFTIIHPQGIRGVFSPGDINDILALTERLAA